MDSSEQLLSSQELISSKSSTEKSLIELERKQRNKYLKAVCDTPFVDTDLIDYLNSVLISKIIFTQGNSTRDGMSNEIKLRGWRRGLTREPAKPETAGCTVYVHYLATLSSAVILQCRNAMQLQVR